ncbi:hypothetical protein AB0C24_13780 [Amycolatopsis japonica]|uniref:hypothetical protein n=1 Tax=Amycolatopsis japonica TaxID=208439 RepID=UPI0034035441
MSTNRIYNNPPRPNVLLQGLPDEVLTRVAPLFTEPRIVRMEDAVHEPEFDILVAATAHWNRSGHLHTVLFMNDSFNFVGSVDVRTEHPQGDARYGQEATLATELLVPAEVTGELGHLVHTHLVPFVSAMPRKPAFSLTHTRNTPSGNRNLKLDPLEACTPFLLASDGSVLAGAVAFTDGGRCWVLPRGVPAPEAWVAAAVKEFHELSPDRVPGRPKWWETPTWATPGQQQARHAVAELENERERLLSDLDHRLVAARGDIELADTEAASGAARLLTADGDDLALAVQMALQVLGFVVVDMDHVHPEGDRREDLRVQDPDHPGWEAIVEVKGYTAGARVNDLSRLLRWKSRYIKETGRDPDALWHVVNAFRYTDPAARPVPIPNDEDLENLAGENGVIIDTREFFRAQRDIEIAAADATTTRATLRAAKRRWTFVVPGSDAPEHA